MLFYKVFYSMMNSKIYSVEELQTLLEGTQEEIQTILLNPSFANNNQYFQNFTAISLRTLKYINHYLNRVNYDQVLGSLIDSIIVSLAHTLDDYRGRNIYQDNRMPIPIAQGSEAEKEEDQIYHFMHTRNTHIPLQCLGSPELDRQRIELAQFVQTLDHKKSQHHKESKKSVELPNQYANKLKMFRKTTFDPKLKTIVEQNRPSVQKEQEVKNSLEAEVQTQLLGSELQKLTEREDDELKSHPGIATATQFGVHFQKVEPQPPLQQDKSVNLDKKPSSKSAKSNQKPGKKGNKFKKSNKSNSNIGAQFFSRQASRKGIRTKEEQSEKGLRNGSILENFKTDKVTLTLNSQEVNFSIRNIEEINLCQLEHKIHQQLRNREDNSNYGLADSFEKRLILLDSLKEAKKNQHTKSSKDVKQMQGSQKSINLQQCSSKQIRQNIQKTSSFTKLAEEEKDHEPQQTSQKEVYEARESSNTDANEQRLNTIAEADELKTSMKISKGKFIKSIFNNTASVLPTAGMQFSEDSSNQETNHDQHISKIHNNINAKRITSLNMKPENLFDKKKEDSLKTAQKQPRHSRVHMQTKTSHGHKRSSLGSSASKFEDKEKQAVQHLLQNGMRSSIFGKNKEDCLLSQNNSSKMQEISSGKKKLCQFNKKGEKTKLKFYASLDHFSKHSSLQENHNQHKEKSPLASSHQNLFKIAQLSKETSLRSSINHKENLFAQFSTIDEGSQKKEGIRKVNKKMTQTLKIQPQGGPSQETYAEIKSSHEPAQTQANQMQQVDHKYVSQCNNEKPNPPKKNPCLLTNKTFKKSKLETAPGTFSQDHSFHNQFIGEDNRKSAHLGLTKTECSQLLQKLRQKGRKETLNQYLDLIEATHRRFCGKNCPHLQHLFNQVNNEHGVVQESVFHQLLRLFRKA